MQLLAGDRPCCGRSSCVNQHKLLGDRYKQRGLAAEAADNVFHPLTYGDIDLSSVSRQHCAALDAQINEFGQCPQQLFTLPHPPRIHSSVSAAVMIQPGGDHSHAYLSLLAAMACVLQPVHPRARVRTV